MMKSICKNVKAYVNLACSLCTQLMNFSDISLNLKQGEPLSPLVFFSFLNDQ